MSCTRLIHSALIVLAVLTVMTTGCSDDAEDSATTSSPEITGKATTGGRASPAAVPLTAEQFELALQLNNSGVALVENLQFADADLKFTQLRQLLPDHPLPARNLAVTRVLGVVDRRSPYSRSRDADEYVAAVRDAEAAIEALRELADGVEQKGFADLLAGRLAAHDDSPERPRIEEAITLLTTAAEASGDKPHYWFALASALEGHATFSRSPLLIETLLKCRKLAPDNLFVLARLLDAMAVGLTSTDPAVKSLSAQLPTVLDEAVPLLEPLNASVREQRRIDLVEMIHESTTADDPTANVGTAMMIKNLLVAELAGQIDQRAIDRNLLEYLQLSFSPLPELAPGAREELFRSQSPPVLSGFEFASGLPKLSGVTQSAFADMNLDGVDDLVVAANGELQIFLRQAGAEGAWAAPVTSDNPGVSVEHFVLVDLTRDYDRAISDVKAPLLLRDPDGDQKVVTDPAGKHRWYDTDPDVVMWEPDGLVIARNDVDDNGGRVLTVLPQADVIGNITDVVAADIEADGDLDLAVATSDGIRLLQNRDGETFMAWPAHVTSPEIAFAALTAVDWNRDMAMDITAVSIDGRFGVLQNLLHGRLRWRELGQVAGTAVDLTVEDFDHDAEWNALLTGSVTTTVDTEGERNAAVDLGNTAATIVADFDNDGSVDVVRCDAETGAVSFHRGFLGGEFLTPEELVLPDVAARGGCATDFDDDGDLDLVLIADDDGRLLLLINEGGNQNHWITVVPRAVPNDPQFPSNRVNMHGIGSVIELRRGASYQGRVVTQPKMHFGIGQHDQLDALRVIWTDGIPQNIVTDKLLQADIGVLAPQILLGSCPYIYTWTGERFEFFSDCLWAAPLGLIQANGDLAPTREWEHLLIPGDRLVARDGRYVLQLTEELWETAYFDEVRLMAVDHPADVEVLTNEKVGSAEMAAHRLHTVRHRVLPDRVTDKHGRDCRLSLTASDGQYLQPFDARILQGLTDEWTLEFHCRRPQTPRSLRLVLEGWVFPTDTSLNQAILQNPSLDPPLPPVVEVLDDQGDWQVVEPFIGFPGGKTKTIVVDLSSVIRDADVRFRLRSSMELYFDAAWFIVDETDELVSVQECPLAAADLHYRGYSRRRYSDDALFRRGHAPESYDYEAVTTEQRWQPIAGRFTRYGDTAPLLTAADDLLVVMSPGDELTVEFTAPDEPIPEGWTRDFVLYNVGWDKDANLNTIYSQSSEPYPWRGMTAYPFGPDDVPPDSDMYRAWLHRFQTRRMSLRELRHQLRNDAAR